MPYRVAHWLFGISPAEPGQGTEWRLGSNFPWPAGLTVLFCVLAAAYIALIYRRDAAQLTARARVCLTVLRLAGLGVLLFMLSHTVLLVERTGLPYVVVLLDVSGSMATEDEYTDSATRAVADELLAADQWPAATRLNLAKALLRHNRGDVLKRLLSAHKLRLYSLADAETPLGAGDLLRSSEIEPALAEIEALRPRGSQTRLGDAVRRVLVGLRGTPPSAIILLSDGINTDGEALVSAARYARQKSVPLFTIGIGRSEPTLDLELHDLVVDEVAFVNDPVPFVFKLTGHGFTGKRARVTLRAKGQPGVLATKEVVVAPDGQSRKVELSYVPPHPGEFDISVEVEPLPKESNVKNNREARHVSVRNEKIRVLLVDSGPRWEFREVKVLLEREKTIELKTVLQDADPDFAQEDRTALPHVPVRREDLWQFDVIILGDVSLGYLSSSVLENLREFVDQKGGGLLFMAGAVHNPLAYADTPLEPLLPIELSGARISAPTGRPFKPELTVEGRKGTTMFRLSDTEQDSQAVWDSLPGLFWMVEAPVLKPGARALAVHPTLTGAKGKLPVIALQRFGAGKVLFHATDETWRWRFRTGDAYFGRYWVQAIRYLSRSKLIGRDRAAELTVDRGVYKSGDTVQFRARFLDDRLAPAGDDGVEVVVERAGEAQRRVKLQRIPDARAVFEGQLPQAVEGTYHAWIAVPTFTESPPSQDFKVETQSRETKVLRADLSELRRAAELTPGGKAYTLVDARDVVRDIPPGLPVPLQAEKPVSLWNHWLTLTAFGTLLILEWILRRRWRLL